MDEDVIQNPQEQLEKDLKYIKDSIPERKQYYPKWVNEKRFGYFPVTLKSQLYCCPACVFNQGEHNCGKERTNKETG